MMSRGLQFGECTRCRIAHVLRDDGACTFIPDPTQAVPSFRDLAGATLVVAVILAVLLIAVVGGVCWVFGEAVSLGAHAVRDGWQA